MPYHLPLSPVDRAIQPPVYYLQVQDSLILSVSIFWTIAYVLYVRQGYRDKSYGMPLFALAGNIAWEFLFGVAMPTSVAQVVCFVPWLVIDVFIVHTTWKYGARQFKQSPVVANNLGLVLVFGVAFVTASFYFFIKTVGLDAASFYLGYSDQLLISITSLAQLLRRNNTLGHSWGIWFCRTFGTFLSIVLFSWRYYHYPDSYPRVAEPIVVFFFVTSEVFDVLYAFVYAHIERKEKDAVKEKSR
ncbi:Terpene cyclase atmB [Diaporthe eres]|uniref:Integral membrane protein n=1 Tax=Diaporthe vaccinii TaxID=105482 RepID=A0ABR4E8S1_9PEZI|nr:Terpene cyclase atmB [Diaporthe eres]